MKILLNTSYDHPLNSGGVSTFNRNIINIFSDEELVVLAYYSNKLKLFSNNIKNLIELYPKNRIFRSIDARIFKYKVQKYMLKNKIKKTNPDICIFNSPNDLEVIIDDKNIKKILVQHINFDKYIEIYGKDRIVLGNLIKKIDYFVCLSECDKQRFSKELNISLEKFEVIRHISNIELRKEKKEKNKILVMIARLHNEQKRFDLAIKSMKKLPDYTLKIYGDGDLTLFEELINKNNLKNVELCGPTNKIKEKLDEAGIFIMTSDYEGYPISTIEAMRRGLPIILRDTFDSAKDIVINNGILLEKEWNEDKFVEAVEEIYNNYKYYSENSNELGKRYDFKLIKSRWNNLILKTGGNDEKNNIF